MVSEPDAQRTINALTSGCHHQIVKLEVQANRVQEISAASEKVVALKWIVRLNKEEPGT
jgi:hypothetical protein